MILVEFGRARVSRPATTGPRNTAVSQTTARCRANQSDNAMWHHIPATAEDDHDHGSSLHSAHTPQQGPLRSFYTCQTYAGGPW
jgi:hypothetical protein